VEHAGSVVIGRGVVVLAGAVIARALFRSPTTIGDYCQIGIMANIGHGARIGRRSVIAGNCVVAGRCKIGEFVRMGASCSVAQAIRVGDRARIHMGSVVVDNVEPHQIVSGNFAMPHSKTMRAYLRDRG
jgi:UDP-3-O-[3-hydroxymyristoyl] glucosamine N-acyltransferase